MKYYVEESLTNFKFWSGAKDRASHLTYADLEKLDDILDDGTEWTDTAINDLFWFEEDYIADLLGYPSWEVLENIRDGYEVYWDTVNDRMLTEDELERWKDDACEKALAEWDSLDADTKADYGNEFEAWAEENYPELESLESFMYAMEIEVCE